MNRSATQLRQDPPLGFVGVSPDDIVSVAGIAELLKVGIATAHRYVNRPDFPAPLGRAAGSRVWLRADVEKWDATRPELRPGRPRKEST